jgi:hypothetical protein
VLLAGDLSLDPVTRVVRRGTADVALSPKDFALLHELMRRPGEVLSRTHLIDHVWDFAYDGGSNVVDVYVRYLRDNVDRPFGRNTIRTVRGVGYGASKLDRRGAARQMRVVDEAGARGAFDVAAIIDSGRSTPADATDHQSGIAVPAL